jgi:iron complex transport system ATP-binding protein
MDGAGKWLLVKLLTHEERALALADDAPPVATLILVTHHIEEIVPDIHRVILLRDGRVAAAAPKRSVLTAKALSELFDAPIALDEIDG